ncbi:MAG: response regulator transcription factor [Desulfobulbus sp.]
MELLKVLIVDDEADFTEIITDRLCSWGFAATAAADGGEALEAIAINRPDVVVLNLRTVWSGGLETLRMLRDLEPAIPVLLLIGKGMTLTGMQGMRLGAFDCLSQPVELGLLIEKIRQAHDDGYGRETDCLPGTGLALLFPWVTPFEGEEIFTWLWEGMQVLLGNGSVW